jgi:zinc transporter 9
MRRDRDQRRLTFGMSSSVSLSIGTITAIAAAKGFGWFLTGSPTLFAETIHSIADVVNQVLLRIGEVRGRHGPDALHPFGRGQEKFFWALVSAVSVFFIGCGLNVYHGVHALLQRTGVEPFTPLVLGLLLFSLALESFTFVVALREIGGWKGISRNRSNTTVLAVLLEDAVALLGILLTLLVAAVSFFWGPHAEFDAVVAIAIGVLLGGMALFLAAINRRLLIDTSDEHIDRIARKFLADQGIPAQVSSIMIDDKRSVVFVRVRQDDSHGRGLADTYALGEALKAHALDLGKKIESVYWKFPAPGAA